MILKCYFMYIFNIKLTKYISVLAKITPDMSKCKKKWTFSVQEDLIRIQIIFNQFSLSMKTVSIFVDKMKNPKR